jgi:cell division protein FtsW (lipid II flippase)
MTPHAKVAIGGVIIGLIFLAFAPWWLTFAIIVIAIAAQTVAWMSLDASQRRRFKEIRRRQINR